MDLHRRRLSLPLEKFNFKQILSVETIVSLPILVSLFVFFPRFTTSFGRTGNNIKNSVGFSKELNPGKLAQLTQSNELAFSVEFKNNQIPNPENLYFRGFVFDQNNDLEWTTSSRQDVKSQNSLPDDSSEPEDYKIILEPRFDKTLFTLDKTQKILIQPRTTYFFHFQSNYFELKWPAHSKLIILGFTDSKQLHLDTSNQNLQTKIQPSVQLQNLIKQILKRNTDEEKVSEILNYFKIQGFQYSTETPEYKTIDDFLFKTKIGFCEHYASSFSALARLAGIPSRVVIGFQGGELNPFGNYLAVRDKYAHAWSEVYLQNKGWIRVDPTSVIYPARITNGQILTSATNDSKNSTSKILSNLIFAFEAFNSRFELLLMNFNFEQQSELLSNFHLKNINFKTLIFILIAIILATLIISILLQKKSRKKDLVATHYESLLSALAQYNFKKSDSEGPLEFKNRIKSSTKIFHESIFQSLDQYIQIRYSENPLDSSIFYKTIRKAIYSLNNHHGKSKSKNSLSD